jgi:hypothetical protein
LLNGRVNQVSPVPVEFVQIRLSQRLAHEVGSREFSRRDSLCHRQDAHPRPSSSLDSGRGILDGKAFRRDQRRVRVENVTQAAQRRIKAFGGGLAVFDVLGRNNIGEQPANFRLTQDHFRFGTQGPRY